MMDGNGIFGKRREVRVTGPPSWSEGIVVEELNRDLLVAVLALLTDAIPRHCLSTALSAWTEDRQESLIKILLRDGAIEPERLQALRCLVDSHLVHHGNDLRACVDAWNAHILTEEVLTEVRDGALRTTLGFTLAASDATLPPDAAPGGGDETIVHPGQGPLGAGAGADVASSGGMRFLPIRPHARGGIGQVWVARDRELQREVAFKVMQDRFVDRPDQRARFLLEAEITGQLEHPGIVPVYSLGHDERGRPYYAMRFIRGESLASAIRKFHQRWPGDAAGTTGAGPMWGIEFRQLLGRFLDVCDAIDYAHSRGVLHRDLKPANIMLGRYGETLVVDWGLAKVVGQPDIVPTCHEGDAEDEAEPSLAASGARSTAGDTQPGTTIGTLAYMSPEQARGALDEMGPASDVYSLGATLYELLTGRVAFAGEKAADVLSKVIKGEFPPPHSCVRSVPPPLEAICLRAMAVERRGRYDTVREMARDIEHWLADEPVSAYRESRPERAGRWLRQHRTWTYASAAALLGITLAASVGMVVVEGGRRREAQARALAERNFNLANRAVDDYFTKVSENTLLKQQDSWDLRTLRDELLTTALVYYQDFLRQRGGDRKLRRELAAAQFRVGRIRREISQPEEAIAAFDESIRIWRDLLDESPADPDVRSQLATALLGLGEQRAWIKDYPRAFSALAQARDLLEGLAAEKPAETSHRVALAECNKEMGIALGESGNPDGGLERLDEAQQILRGLLERSPGDYAYLKRLADVINARGFILDRRGDVDGALRSFREFQRICQKLLESLGTAPTPVELLNSLAISYYNIGAIEYQREHLKALEPWQKSLEYRKALAETHPSVNDFRGNLAVILADIATLQYEAGHESEAFTSVNQSIGLLEELVKAQPEQPHHHGNLGRALGILGYLYDESRRDNVRALPVFERALREDELALAGAPESEPYARDRIVELLNLGEQYADLGRVDEAIPYYRRAVEASRQFLAAGRGNRARALGLADHLMTLATVERHSGHPEDAGRSYGEARQLLERLAAAEQPPDAEVQALLAAAITGEAVAAADLGSTVGARQALRRALEILEPLVADDRGALQGRSSPRGRLTIALWEASRLARSSGDRVAADRADAQLADSWRGRDPSELAILALQDAGEAARIGYGQVTVNPIGMNVRRLELDRAADELRLAISMGFRDLSMLHRSRDWLLLLSHPAVRVLFGGLEFPADVFQPGPR